MIRHCAWVPALSFFIVLSVAPSARADRLPEPFPAKPRPAATPAPGPTMWMPPPDAGGAKAAPTIAELEADLSEQESMLATADCIVACRALASMDRAANRICDLDPGAKCTEARVRVAKAAEQVRAKCPDCAAAQPRTEPRAIDVKISAEPASAPPESHRGGGCAGCTITSEGRAGAGGIALVVALVATMLRRRRDPAR